MIQKEECPPQESLDRKSDTSAVSSGRKYQSCEPFMALKHTHLGPHENLIQKLFFHLYLFFKDANMRTR